MKYSCEPPACFSNFVLPCRKKEKAGNNRSPVLNDSRVLSRHQFDFSPLSYLPPFPSRAPSISSLPPSCSLYSRVCLLSANHRHPRFYRKVFAVSVGRTGHPSWRVERERSARNVNTNIMIYRRNIGQIEREREGGGGDSKGRKGGCVGSVFQSSQGVAKHRRKRRMKKRRWKAGEVPTHVYTITLTL